MMPKFSDRCCIHTTWGIIFLGISLNANAMDEGYLNQTKTLDPLTVSQHQQLKKNANLLQTLTQQVADLNNELNIENNKIEELKNTQQLTQDKLTKQQQNLAEQIRITYKLGRAQSVKTMLSPESVNTVNRHLSYYHYLGKARLELVTEIKSSLAALNENMKTTTEHEAHLKVLLQRKQHQQLLLLQAQDRRQQIIITHPQEAKIKAQKVIPGSSGDNSTMVTAFDIG